ncbi:MAG TPA: hypothetical protein DCS93_35725 [Microscillaceae bacterium]|nr:hypothetical protein [Microscillaceae bacterium]
MSHLQFHLISKQTVQEVKAYLQNLIAHYFEFLSESQQVAITISGDAVSTGLICNLNLNPIQGKIGLGVNGLTTIISSDDNKNGVAYFSKDGGVTAISSNYQGATLYWNESVAGFKLKPWHTITFFSVYQEVAVTP